MNVYQKNDIGALLKQNAYAGRGIIVGTTPDGQDAVSAYFIMGRSANSRNRIFVEENGAVLRGLSTKKRWKTPLSSYMPQYEKRTKN